jgi:dihydrofolate reductase
MRKVTYGAAVSLDLHLAGPDGEIDWLRWSADAAAIAAESFKGVDTMLMGRRTFEFAQKMGGGPGAGGVRTYVFSRTLERLPGEGAELVREDAAGFVRRLKEEPGGVILLMGGGALAGTLIEAGMVDEIGLNVHPVLLGGGAPAFGPMAGRAGLELVEARTIQHGCVFLRYCAPEAQ